MGARLAWNNLLTDPAVVITSSSEATGYVDDNLASHARWKKWRSATSTADQWVKFDLGSSRSMQLLAVMNATIHAGGTLHAQANATDVWTAPTVNDLLTVPANDFTQVLADWWTTAQSFQWVRFYFTNTAAVSAYVEIGAVFGGLYLEPARTFGAEGLSVRRIDPSVQRYAVGGQRSSVLRSKYHQVDGTFVIQKATARNAIRAAYEVVGATTAVIFALDPLDPSLTFYGTLQSTLSAEHRLGDLWDMPVQFIEDVA